jgi:predicted HTH transcriptional regulator
MANIAAVTLGRRIHSGREGSRIPLAIITNKNIGPGAKLVYSKLLSYASTRETATNNRLAVDLGVSPRSIRNYISALKSAGLVKVRLHAGKASSYELTVAF